jgi:hypothetical protein
VLRLIFNACRGCLWSLLSSCSCILNAWDATVIHSLVQSPCKAMPIFIFDNQQISSLKYETEIVFLLLCSNVLKSLFLSETWYMCGWEGLCCYSSQLLQSLKTKSTKKHCCFLLFIVQMFDILNDQMLIWRISMLKLFTSMSICLNWEAITTAADLKHTQFSEAPVTCFLILISDLWEKGSLGSIHFFANSNSSHPYKWICVSAQIKWYFCV